MLIFRRICHTYIFLYLPYEHEDIENDNLYIHKYSFDFVDVVNQYQAYNDYLQQQQANS